MGFISVLPQGEMTVFRAVETWLSARREEMAKEGEQFWLRMIQQQLWGLHLGVFQSISKI